MGMALRSLGDFRTFFGEDLLMLFTVELEERDDLGGVEDAVNCCFLLLFCFFGILLFPIGFTMELGRGKGREWEGVEVYE